jgi:uroporphyrinogen-III synthase
MKKNDRETVLYLGIDPSNYHTEKFLIHYPLITTQPRPYDSIECKHVFSEIPNYTHLLFSSKTTVRFFFDCLRFHGYEEKEIADKSIIAIGRATALAVEKFGVQPTHVANRESSDGLVRLMSLLDLKEAYIFFPRSSLSKPLLTFFLVERGIRHQIYNLYDTVVNQPKIIQDLNQVDEIVFTSPSTVDAFSRLYQVIPPKTRLRPIGPVTKDALLKKLHDLSTNLTLCN